MTYVHNTFAALSTRRSSFTRQVRLAHREQIRCAHREEEGHIE